MFNRNSFLLLVLFSFFLIIGIGQNVFPQESVQNKDIIYEKSAPNFKAKTILNKDISLSDFKGKIVVLFFWISGTETSMNSMNELISVSKNNNIDDLQVILISLDSNIQNVQKVIAENKITYPVICDGNAWNGEIARSFNVIGLPKIIFIDYDGKIRYTGLQGKYIGLVLSKLVNELKNWRKSTGNIPKETEVNAPTTATKTKDTITTQTTNPAVAPQQPTPVSPTNASSTVTTQTLTQTK